MSELGTKLIFVGGNNSHRIGGSCSIVEHKYDAYKKPIRIMFDLGALFAPDYCLDVDAAIPDVRDYLNTKTAYAPKSIDALFLSHAHEDHIGGYVHLLRAGYEMPPTYASKSTLELLKGVLKDNNIDARSWPKMIEVQPQEPVKFSCMEIEAINVSHSTLGALGFHTLTSVDGKTEAGIFHPGDYHLGPIAVGDGFKKEELQDLLVRKPLTNVILDSTSSASDDKYLVTHGDAVRNTVAELQQHPEKQVISAVISRSIQNLAIDIEAARATNRKIYLDGHMAKVAYKAMQKAGFTDFDDVIFKGTASDYKKRFPAAERYIVTSGAFAESKKGRKSGLYKLSEQEKITLHKNKKAKDKKNKPLTGHPDFQIDTNTLILARQRCIEDINGKQVRAMYARLASLGAFIVANDSATPLGPYRTALMQRSGHAVKSETVDMIKMIQDYTKNPQNITYIPTHGNPEQMMNTARNVKEQHGKFFFSQNLDILKVGAQTEKIGELDNHYWIGVCEEGGNNPSIRNYTYSLVDENMVVQEILKQVTQKVVRYDNKNKSYHAPSREI